MDAGEWQYIGVNTGTFPGTDDETYIVEAHLPRRRSDWYVRLQIAAMGDAEAPWEPLTAYKVLFDVVSPNGLPEPTAILPLYVGELARVPYSRLLSQAAADLNTTDYFSPDNVDLPDFRELRKAWPSGRDADEVARWAGWLYTRAVIDGQSATRAVEDAFGVSRSTAKRIITRARDLGHIADNVVGAPVPQRKRKEHHDGER